MTSRNMFAIDSTHRLSRLSHRRACEN